MKTRVARMVVRGFLLAGLVVFGLVSSDSLDKSSCVAAKTCDEAFADYVDANSTYEVARLSYFYGIPTTCQQQCEGDPNPNCVSDCQTSRYTDLGNADMALFSLAQDTCTPLTLDACAQARAMADDCNLQYNPLNYSDMEEAAAVASQLSACREASKVDSCQ